VTSGNTGVGTITVSPVTISGGANTVTTAFHPVANGTSVISVGTPPGFTTPASLTSLTATVATPSILITDGVSVGQNLEFVGQITLGQPAPPGGLVVTLTSADPSRLILSASGTTAGAANGVQTINVPEGTSTAQFFLQALGNSGTVSYTASAPGYNPKTATITLTPSGLVLVAPTGRNFTTSVGAGPTQFILMTAQLDASNNPVGTQAVRGGLSLSVTLTSANPAVGTIQSPITIPAGTDTVTPTFTPLAAGNTTVNAQQPANIGLSTQTTVNVTVNP